MVALQNVGFFLRLIKEKRAFLITYRTKRRDSVGSIFDEVRSVRYGMKHRFSYLIRGLFKSDLGGKITRFQLMSRRPSFFDEKKAVNCALFQVNSAKKIYCFFTQQSRFTFTIACWKRDALFRYRVLLHP